MGLEGQAPAVRNSELISIDAKIDLTKTRITDVLSTLVVGDVQNATDAQSQAMYEIQIALLPMMEFKGTMGGWYKKRGEEPNPHKGYFAVQDISFSVGDSSDNAGSLSAIVGIAAICTALAF